MFQVLYHVKHITKGSSFNQMTNQKNHLTQTQMLPDVLY